MIKIIFCEKINKVCKSGGTFKIGVLPNSFPTWKKPENRFLLGAALSWKSNIRNP